MLKYNLKIAWRNLKKDRFYSLINIVGLATASAAFLLIINFVKFEYSYEDFHENADRIYRVTTEMYQGSQLVSTDCETAPALAPELKEKMPEVTDYVRVQMMEDDNEISYNNQVYRIDKIYAADPSVFDIFHHEFIQGDPSTALDAPMTAVVSESLAKRLFGNAPAKGKTVKNGEYLFTITGVIRDSPSNTHLKVEILLSFSSLVNMGWDLNSWGSWNNYTYLRLAPHPDLEAFNKKLFDFRKEKFKDLDHLRVVAEPIKDIHLYSHKGWEPEVNGNIRTVRFLFITAFLILLIGSVNYLNLATARASERAGEVGMRKILGSNRRSLISQFLTETLLINLTAMVLALLLIWGILPFYFRLIGRPVEVDFFTTSMFWITCAGLFLFNCLLSGLYPAFNLSSARPASVVKRSFTGSREGNLFRKVLVVGQFAIALIVLSAAFIVFRQLSFMQNQDLGINTSEMLVIRAPKFGTDSLRLVQSRTFKNELSQLSDVEKVSVAGSLPGISLHELSSTTSITQYGSDKGRGYNYYLYGIDTDFIPTMEIELATGRNFRPGSVSTDEVIINEEAVRTLGFENPEKALNKKISVWFSEQAEIIGVVKDFHQQSLKGAVLPMIHWHSNQASFYAVKLHTKDIQKTVADIGSAWKTQFPGHSFDYYFYDQMFNEQYKADQRFGKIVSVFSILTLLITCLGLLGLTAYTVSKRTKEIGIRKVLGASVAHIVTLLSKDFIKLVLIAIIIASPIAWYAMNRWLENFAYRIELQWWIFVLTGTAAVVIALITVSGQSIKAATANPVKSLRTE
ncbi:ABC transporter permease [Sinomicrobium sp. M5D2P17]